MLTTQETIDIDEAIGIVLNHVGSRLTGEFDLTKYIESVRGLGLLVPDHPINNAFEFYQERDNEVFNQYRHLLGIDDCESKDIRYYSTCVMRMLLSHLFGGRGFTFETQTPYDVRIQRNDTVYAISYYCGTGCHTVAVDIWELDCIPVMHEIQKRINWIEAGNKPEDYPIQVKTNHYHVLKEAK